MRPLIDAYERKTNSEVMHIHTQQQKLKYVEGSSISEHIFAFKYLYSQLLAASNEHKIPESLIQSLH